MSKVSALDYFKSTWEKNSKPSPINRTCEDYLASQSVRNTYGIQTYKNTHRPTEEKPLATLMNSGLSSVKVINNRKEGIEVSISACNRVQEISINSELTLSYNNCTKVEEITNTTGYEMFIRNGYKLYNLYKYNFVANRETVHMVIAAK